MLIGRGGGALFSERLRTTRVWLIWDFLIELDDPFRSAGTSAV
jgi:hypothetical protein